MNKPRIAEICAEEAHRQGYKEVDAGMPDIMLDMYDACLKRGFIKRRHNHPILRIRYISHILSLDCKRENGSWYYAGKMDYPGICKHAVNVYRLRSFKEEKL